jgi:hypothetical protein
MVLVALAVGASGLTCLGGTGGSGYPKTAAWVRRTINTGAHAGPSVVAVADFDGDSMLDVAVGYPGAAPVVAAVFIFFQDTTESFTAVELASSADLEGVAALAIADLNNDGSLDIVAACNGRLVFLNSPAAPRTEAWTQSTIAESSGTGLGQWTDVAIGAIDAANGPDIVACNSEAPGRVSWFASPSASIANGAGWTRTDVDMAMRSGASSVALADFNADGRQDVVSTATGESADRIAWYANPTDPVNDAWTKHAIGNLTSATRMVVADINADGRSDVVGLNGPGRQIGWYQRPTDATTAWTGYLLTMYTTATPVDVKAADVDGDGQIDIVVATNSGGTLRWFVPFPGMTQTAQWLENNLIDVAETIGRIALGDIDGDGRPDVIAPLLGATTAADSVVWLENPE